MKAVDVHGFGGGFTLGAVQAGWELEAKMSREVGFGVLSTLANRHLLGGNWESNPLPPDQWPKHDVDMVFGNPPCSGFSSMGFGNLINLDYKATINDYMWELIGYAGRVAPPIVIWESVQGTFKRGLELMRQLHAQLESLSGKEYHLTHVLHNNLSHGGAADRKRYFFVAHRVPFGVDANRVTRDGRFMPLVDVPTMADVLTDLMPLGNSMAPQPYRAVTWFGDHAHVAGSLWAHREMHDGSGLVDGHAVYANKRTMQVEEMFHFYPDLKWQEGEFFHQAIRRAYAGTGTLPPSWHYQSRVRDADGNAVMVSKAEHMVSTDFGKFGFSQPRRWYWDRPALVITGGATTGVVHPKLPRMLTFREIARIQGYPDDWKIQPLEHVPDMRAAWGKGVPVQAARWIARWALEALGGSPGPQQGVPLREYDSGMADRFGDHPRERVVDTTDAWKRVTHP